MYPHVVCIYTTSLRGGFKPGTRCVVFPTEEQEYYHVQIKTNNLHPPTSRGIPEIDRFSDKCPFPNREFQLPCVCLSMWNHLSATRALESFSPRCASSSSSSSSELWPCQTVTAVDIYCFFGLCQKQYPT